MITGNCPFIAKVLPKVHVGIISANCGMVEDTEKCLNPGVEQVSE